jgi:uncharacterized protein involved in copper resistance
MNINVFIERLILDGLPIDRTQGPLIHAAVETELRRLLAECGMDHSSGGAVPHLSANAIQMTHASGPAHLGHQIARAIHGTLTPAPVPTRESRSSGPSHR